MHAPLRVLVHPEVMHPDLVAVATVTSAPSASSLIIKLDAEGADMTVYC